MMFPSVQAILSEHLAELELEHAEMMRRVAKLRANAPTNEFCGAKTRAGTPCKRRDIYPSGRCRLHGGLSTGPKTEAGREQSRINGRKGGRPKRNPSP
ncbi:HGGxSTG domain-containing protein [Thiocapsa rosea]|uniref:Uncharacterized protein n=1 Tax=Thiocapsa rosea TaxID=69360 RepID=A0A495VEE2_9GAMM|nr:hypothetical protein BDD21_4342 [Thiocapsa rosea]